MGSGTGPVSTRPSAMAARASLSVIAWPPTMARVRSMSSGDRVALADLVEPCVHRRVTGGGRRVALHFAQDQLAIDQAGGHGGNGIRHRPGLDETERDGRARVAQRDRLAADDGKGPFDEFR